MKRSREWKLPRATRFCVLIVAATALIAPSVPASAQTITTFTEWPVPTVASEPLHLIPLSNRVVFFTERTASKIGSLNMKQSIITEWPLAMGAGPHGIRILKRDDESDGATLVFCEQNGNIARLNSQTNVLTEWPVPTAGSLPVHSATRGAALVFFTEFNGNKIGLLNLATDRITEWGIPTVKAFPNGIAISVGNEDENEEEEGKAGILVWFPEEGDGGAPPGKIGMLNPATNTFTEWTPPSGSSPSHLRVSNGRVFFNDFGLNAVGRLNPRTNTITEWTVPTTNSQPEDVQILFSGLVAFTEGPASLGGPPGGNKIGTLDPTTPGMDTVVTPTVTSVTPSQTTVMPKRTTLVPTTMSVKPVVTFVTGVVTGGFVEYPVPTANGGPLGIWQLPNSALIFTEENGNKIGLLQLVDND